MNSITLPSSLALQPPLFFFSCHSQLNSLSILSSNEIRHFHTIPRLSISPLLTPKTPFLCCYSSSIGAAVPSEEGAIPVLTFEDFVEKDWSFLDSEDVHQSITQIISAGGITETSKVLVSMSSEEFVDQLVDTSPCGFLLLVHESLFTLALVKEKYDDRVKCWQGELIHLPEKWASLDVVFLYFFQHCLLSLTKFLGNLPNIAHLVGARVVISHPQGREKLEQQRGEYQELIVSELPDELSLQKVATLRSFEVVEFVDEPGFYRAVLRFASSTES